MIGIKKLQAISTARCNRWHPGGISDWSLSDWGVALGGEVGEAQNIIKKLNRVRNRIINEDDPPEGELKKDLAEELADILCYLVLVAECENIDLESAVIAKFNKVSQRQGFPERIGETVKGDVMTCYCGKTCTLDEAETLSPDPYAILVCPSCFEARMDEKFGPSWRDKM